MAELQIAPARPSSSTSAVLISLLILSAVAAATFYFNPHKVSEFKVTSVDTYEPHTTFTALEGAATTSNGTHVLEAPSTSSEVNLYVVAHVSLTDKLRLPLFITGATARVTMEDGTVLESTLLSNADLKRLEVIFPQIGAYAQNPLSDGDEIAPGQTYTRTVVLPFPGQTAAAWHSKKSATLKLELRNQQAQTAGLP